MSIQAVAWALKVKIADPVAKLILISLADHHNESTGLCCPRHALLAEVAGCSERSVIRKLAVLRDAGLIETAPRYCGNGRQTTNSYRLIIGCQPVTHPPAEGCQPVTPEGDSHLSPQEPQEEPLEGARMRERKAEPAAPPRREPPANPLDLVRRSVRKPTRPQRYRASQADIELYRKMAEGVL